MTGRRALFSWVIAALAAAGAGWWIAGRQAEEQRSIELGAVDERPGERQAVDAEDGEGQSGAGAPLASARDEALAPIGGLEAGDIDDFTLAGVRAADSERRARTSVAGRVLDGEGQPVAGARVLASVRETLASAALDAAVNVGRSLEAQSASDGTFLIAGLDPGSARLSVRAAGFAPLDAPRLSLPAGERTEVGDLRLARGVVLAGRVVDGARLTVAGARLSLRDTPLSGPTHLLGALACVPLADTDAAGRFELPALAPGKVELLVTAAEFPEQAFTVDAPADRARIESLELALEAGAEIRGLVQDYDPALSPGLVVVAVPEDGAGTFGGQDEPLRGIEVKREQLDGSSALWHTATRRAEVEVSGSFRVPGLSPGRTYELFATQASRLSPADLARADPWAPRVSALAGDAGVELTYLPGARLELQAVDAATGAPVEHLRVRLTGAWPAEPAARPGGSAPQSVFPDGKVVLTDLRATEVDGPVDPGDLLPDSSRSTLSVEAPGYDVETIEPLRLEPGRRLDIGMVRLFSLALYPVRVVEAETSRPIGGARVELATTVPVDGRGRSSGVTDARGLARLTSLASLSAKLTVECPGYAVRQLDVPGQARAGALPFEVALLPAARVAVHVHDQRGEPAGAVTVVVSRLPAADGLGWVRSELTDAGGTARFTDVPEGSFRAVAVARGGQPVQRDSGLRTPEAEFSVQSGAALEIELEVLGFSTLSGTIWLGRDPLAGARVSIAADARSFWNLDRYSDDRAPAFRADPRFTTDEHGSFQGVELYPGPYALLIEHPGFGVQTVRTVRVERGPTDVILDIDDTAITGRVVDARGEPVDGATVQLLVDPPGRRRDWRPRAGEFLVPYESARRPIAEVRTDATGAYRLRCVPPGMPLEMFFAHGSRTASKPRVVAFQGRSIDNVNAVLPDGGGLLVALTAPLPPSGLHYGVRVVCLEQPEGLALFGSTFGPDGRALFDDLHPGNWVVLVLTLDEHERVVERREPQAVAVKAGQITEFSVGW